MNAAGKNASPTCSIACAASGDSVVRIHGGDGRRGRRRDRRQQQHRRGEPAAERRGRRAGPIRPRPRAGRCAGCRGTSRRPRARGPPATRRAATASPCASMVCERLRGRRVVGRAVAGPGDGEARDREARGEDAAQRCVAREPSGRLVHVGASVVGLTMPTLRRPSPPAIDGTPGLASVLSPSRVRGQPAYAEEHAFVASLESRRPTEETTCEWQRERGRGWSGRR